MGTKLTQMHLHGEVAELHPFALNTVAICWPSPATHERIDKALVFLAHPGNWLAGPQTPFSITHNLTVCTVGGVTALRCPRPVSPPQPLPRSPPLHSHEVVMTPTRCLRAQRQ